MAILLFDIHRSEALWKLDEGGGCGYFGQVPQYEFSMAVRKDVTINVSRELGVDRPIPEGARPEDDWQRPVRMTLGYRDERGHDTTVTEWDERIIWGKGMGVETLVRSIESAACRDAAFQFGGECVYVLTFHGKDHPHRSRFLFKIPGGQEVNHLARTPGLGEGRAKDGDGFAERIMPDILRYVQGKEEMLERERKVLFETLLKSNQNYAQIIQDYTDRETKLREIELAATDHQWERDKKRKDEEYSDQMKRDLWDLFKKNGPKIVPHVITAMQRLGGGNGLTPLQLQQLQQWGQSGVEGESEGEKAKPSGRSAGGNGVKNGARSNAKVSASGKKEAAAGEESLLQQMEMRVAFDSSRFVMLVRGRGQEKIIAEALSEEQRELWNRIAELSMSESSEEVVRKLARAALEFGGAVQADPEVGFKLLGMLDDYSKIALVELSKVLEVYQIELVKEQDAGAEAKAGGAEVEAEVIDGG